MNKKLKILLILLLNALSCALISTYAVNKFNVLNLIERFINIPEDLRYGYCISIYFTFVNTISTFIIELIVNEIYNKRPRMEAIIFCLNEEPELQHCPTILFNKDKIAEIGIKIVIKGKRKYFRNRKITIKSDNFITLQPASKISGVETTEDGDYEINLDLFIGGEDVIDVEQSFRILIEECVPDGLRTVKLSPTLNKRNKWAIYESNHAKVKGGER